jgi:hypothetical protein
MKLKITLISFLCLVLFAFPGACASNSSTVVSRDQALGIACQCFPASVILQSKITVTLWPKRNLNNPVWQISLTGFNTTRDALLEFGWSASLLTLGDPGYHFALINVDAETGAILDKSVAAFLLAQPPD